MTAGELEVLGRAHALFAGDVGNPAVEARAIPADGIGEQRTGAMAVAHREAASAWRADLDRARETDAEMIRILAEAHRDHGDARHRTGAVLAAARADAATVAYNPIAARELLRRRALRLRAQHAHVLAARHRAGRRRSELRALRYRLRSRRKPGRGRRAEVAVRAALSRLGRPYVWGATGPDRFDCSGLVQWAYARAGVPLHRTTYQQINDGVPIARSQVRPGDLVFPHAGHVQMAIGDNLVVEAPQPGATVQISRMGENVAIRRPG